MLTNVYDVEMKRIFFDERIQCNYEFYIEDAVFDRLMAYDGYRVATKNLMWFDRTMEYAGRTLNYLFHDEKWDRYVRSDRLQQQAQSLLKVTPGMREFHAMRCKRLIRNFE